MDSKALAFLICAAVAWTAAGYKLAALRRDPRNPALWALTAAIALPAAGFTMSIPAVYSLVNTLLGVPNLASLLVYGCIVGYSVTALIMLMLWHLPAAEARRRSKRLLVFYGLTLAAMVVLFANTGATVDLPSDFDDTYGDEPVGGTFLLVYVSAFAVGLTAAVARGLQFARRIAVSAPERPWLRRGLRLVAAGSMIALGYCIGKAAFVIGAWCGVDLVVWSKVGTMCACAGALVITTGFTMPSWGPRLSAIARMIARFWVYLRLYPLWHTMYRAVPSIALHPPAGRVADVLTLRDLDYRLYRRLVEIRDGRLALAPYMVPAGSEAEEIATRHRLPLAAVREAIQIRHAVDRYRNHEPEPSHPTTTPALGNEPQDELTWLVQVAAALKHVPADRSPATHRTPLAG